AEQDQRDERILVTRRTRSWAHAPDHDTAGTVRRSEPDRQQHAAAVRGRERRRRRVGRRQRPAQILVHRRRARIDRRQIAAIYEQVERRFSAGPGSSRQTAVLSSTAAAIGERAAAAVGRKSSPIGRRQTAAAGARTEYETCG